MSKDNIIEFNSVGSNYNIKYRDMLKSDGYLQLTAINTISSLGYELDEDSIREFQSEEGLEVTGEIGLADLTCAVQEALDVNEAQKVYNYLGDYKILKKKESLLLAKQKRNNNRLLIIASIIAIVFFIIGAVEFYGWLRGIVLSLLRTYM